MAARMPMIATPQTMAMMIKDVRYSRIGLAAASAEKMQSRYGPISEMLAMLETVDSRIRRMPAANPSTGVTAFAIHMTCAAGVGCHRLRW